MRIFLGLLLAICLTGFINCELCIEPQRSFYMSFSSLSKRDTLQKIFDTISTKMTSIDSNYTDSVSKATFILTNILP